MGEKRCFVSEYSSLLLDNRKCEKVDNGMCECKWQIASTLTKF